MWSACTQLLGSPLASQLDGLVHPLQAWRDYTQSRRRTLRDARVAVQTACLEVSLADTVRPPKLSVTSSTSASPFFPFLMGACEGDGRLSAAAAGYREQRAPRYLKTCGHAPSS